MGWKNPSIAVMAIFIIILTVGCSSGPHTKIPVTNSNVVPFIYQMWEKAEQLGGLSSENLSDREWVEFREWLERLDFRALPSLERKDLEECRRAFIDYLRRPPSDGYEIGYRSTELSFTFLPVFVDFDINEERAVRDGQKEDLAESIGLFLNLMEALWLLSSDLEADHLEDAPPQTQLFVKYLYMG